MDGGRSLISAMGTVQVSKVNFHSTHLKTLSASPAGGHPAATGLLAVAGAASSQGCHLVLAKSARCTGPTSAHNKHISVNYSGIQKNYIYKNNIKIKKKKKKLKRKLT
jgi:hypothetical protein